MKTYELRARQDTRDRVLLILVRVVIAIMPVAFFFALIGRYGELLADRPGILLPFVLFAGGAAFAIARSVRGNAIGLVVRPDSCRLEIIERGRDAERRSSYEARDWRAGC